MLSKIASLRRSRSERPVASWIAAREASRPLDLLDAPSCSKGAAKGCFAARKSLRSARIPVTSSASRRCSALKKRPDSDVDDGGGDQRRARRARAPGRFRVKSRGDARCRGPARRARGLGSRASGLASLPPTLNAPPAGAARRRGARQLRGGARSSSGAARRGAVFGRARTLAAEARKELGDAASSRLEQLLAKRRRVVNARGETTGNAERDAFYVAANDFGAELLGRSRPCFVDAEVLQQEESLLPALARVVRRARSGDPLRRAARAGALLVAARSAAREVAGARLHSAEDPRRADLVRPSRARSRRVRAARAGGGEHRARR